jgi:hypothetical protein
MRVTIIPEDQTIIVGGVALEVTFAADSNIHAIQWHDDFGIVEKKAGGSDRFTDIAVIQPYLDAFLVEQTRLATPPVVDEAAVMAAYLSQFKELRLKALSRLDGRQITAIYQGRTSDAGAVETAKQGLRDMTQHPTVTAATTGEEMRLALKNRYYEISAALFAAAPAEYVAFKALDL